MQSLVAIGSTWAVISAFLLFVGGAAFQSSLAGRLGVDRRFAEILYLWHTGFSVLYCWYALHFTSDARGYYLRALVGEVEFEAGTPMVGWIARGVILMTGASFLGVFMVFNAVGSVGLLLFFDTLDRAVDPSQTGLKLLVRFIVLLPSASFWSSAIGKDAIAFLAVCLMLWAVTDGRAGLHHAIAAAVLMALVRPHMAALMVIMLLISVLGSPQGTLVKRLLYAAGLGVSIAYALPWVLDYVGLSDAQDLGQVGAYIDQRQQYNQTGGGAIDISEMSVTAQILSYLFRPLPHEAHSIFALAASVESLLLAVISGVGAWAYFVGGSRGLPGNRLFLWLYVSGGTFVLATTTANLGISLRQKWMILPPLLFVLISALSRAMERPTVSQPQRHAGDQVGRLVSLGRCAMPGQAAQAPEAWAIRNVNRRSRPSP